MPRLLLALALTIAVAGSRQAEATARFLEFVDEVPIPRIVAARATVVSPDGAYAYVVATAEDAVTIYARDPGTGALTFAGLGVTGVDFNRLTKPALSPDGAHLYVIGQRALAVFSRNTGTGALTLIQTKLSFGPDAVPHLGNATDIVIGPDGTHIYVVTPSDDAILRFSRNASTGEVTFEEVMLDLPSTSFGGPIALAMSGDGAFVYVASVFDDVVAIFSRNAGTGALTFVDSESVLNPDQITLSPDGANVYAGSTFTLTVYGRDAGTGALTFQQSHSDGVGGVTLMSGISAILVTADGAHVYVTARGDDALLVFGRNAGNGNLTLVAQNQNGVGGIIGLNDANSVAAGPGGTHLYVAAGNTSSLGGAITVFARNAGTGAVTLTQYLTPREAPSAMALSPDSAHLYSANRDKVSIYARDPGTGALAHTSDVTDGFGGIDGLSGANTVVVSPDGAHVYATALEDTLAVFARNSTTGALTPVEVERDGVGGVDGLNAPQDLAISADGLYVYVTAQQATRSPCSRGTREREP